MKLTKTTTLTVALVLCAGTLFAGKKKPFRFNPVGPHVDHAIAVGTKAAGDSTSLVLKDTAQGWNSAFMKAGGETVGTSTGFSLDIYTPFSWVAQASSWSAKKYQPFSLEDVADEMLSPVLRVFAHADSPQYVSRDGMIGTSGVEHVIVRSTKKKGFEVLQPVSIAPDTDFYQNAMGGAVALTSQLALFDLAEVERIAKLDRKGEFFVVVIGTTGEEKKFKVKTKHFDRLP